MLKRKIQSWEAVPKGKGTSVFISYQERSHWKKWFYWRLGGVGMSWIDIWGNILSRGLSCHIDSEGHAWSILERTRAPVLPEQRQQEMIREINPYRPLNVFGLYFSERWGFRQKQLVFKSIIFSCYMKTD